MLHVFIGLGAAILSLLPIGWSLQMFSYRKRRGWMRLVSWLVGAGGIFVLFYGVLLAYSN